MMRSPMLRPSAAEAAQPNICSALLFQAITIPASSMPTTASRALSNRRRMWGDMPGGFCIETLDG